MTNTLTLTKGQQRVREIVVKMLPEYKYLKKEGETLTDFFLKVREAFCSDPIITSDTCLCQSLFKPRISINYTIFLSETGETETIHNGEYYVDLNRFHYDPPSHTELPVYMSDDSGRWSSTYSCLFGFAEGKEIDRFQWESNYFVDDGILQVAGNGSHRLMACVLWGQHLIKPEKLHVTKATPDPELHDALLWIDEILQHDVDEKFKCYFTLKGHDFDRNSDCRIQLLAESEKIKDFCRSITHKEVMMIREFLSSSVHRFHLGSYHPLPHGSSNIISIDILLKIVRDSQKIASRNIFQRFFAKLLRKYNYEKGNLSIFEMWYFNFPAIENW
jgi:hypothetical protein